MFHDDDAIRKKARYELITYFTKVSQATLGDLTISQTNLDSNKISTSTPNTSLKAVCKQDIRDMRHHIHSQKLGGVVAVTQNERTIDTLTKSKKFNTLDLVENHTNTVLSSSSEIDIYQQSQLDILAYSYPYHSLDHTNMHPSDCILPSENAATTNDLDSLLHTFKIRYPLLQLKFNIHDYSHRPSCFKKGCECRNNLPQDHQLVADIFFDYKNTLTWHFIDGSTRKVYPFKYMPKRNIGDQFMNMNNDIASIALACNNNVTSGDKVRFYYITMYQSKQNQAEEASPYNNICIALSKRLQFKKS